MQLANCHVALGGSRENTVPKYGVTPAEIILLDAIHGSGSVHDIEPAGEIDRPNGEERDRLRAIYGKAMDDDNKPIIEGVFPGAGARLPTTIRELGLARTSFKATGHMTADDEPTEAAEQVAQAAQAAQAINGENSDDIEGVTGGDVAADAPNVLE